MLHHASLVPPLAGLGHSYDAADLDTRGGLVMPLTITKYAYRCGKVGPCETLEEVLRYVCLSSACMLLSYTHVGIAAVAAIRLCVRFDNSFDNSRW